MANLKGLIDRLHPAARSALEAAAALCLTRTQYEVDLEHLLLKLLDDPASDVSLICQRIGIDIGRATQQLTEALDRFKTGNARTPAFSPRLPRLIADAWVVASIDYGEAAVRSGHLLIAALAADDVATLLARSSAELGRLDASDVRRRFAEWTAGSREQPAIAGDSGAATKAAARTKALDQFTIDLTARARAGEIDPVTGRDFEIRQLIDILMRRRQNNPILTGEPGVGKTAVVEGLALRIAEGDVPEPLRPVALRVLDLGLLQAGAGIKGEFENRLKSVIDEVKASPQPIIVFIDEAHTLIGAGGQAGQNDAANLLKPALARGELRTIAATTWSEYKKYFEKDAALARRFQVVKVEEPTPDQAVLMMRYLAPKLEAHHRVRILDEAVEAAVRLSDRYLSARQLPDKAVSVLDTACARLALNAAAVPAPVEDARRRVAAIELEIRVREREQAAATASDARLGDLQPELAGARSVLEGLESRWAQERDLATRVRALRAEIEDAVHTPATVGGVAIDLPTRRSDLVSAREELAALQGDTPLVQAVVDAQIVADVISGWTGIPVGKMKGDEIATILNLENRLCQRVIGQSHALAQIAERIQISRARLEDPRKPIGVFMLVGPSGVGKTETALALADALYGGEQNLITINMSEYQEAHTVSSLKGSPPGYVGYGEGGVLTEAVRRKPYSVVLLDEVEKAHPDVLELFFQVFDKGRLEDGEGREIDFKNTVILLTSNVGTDTVMRAARDETARPTATELGELLRPDLLNQYPPAFLGRLVVVPYFPIGDEVMRQITELQLSRLRARVLASHNARLTYDEAVVQAVRDRCTEVDSGARNVEHIVSRTLLPEISREVLGRMAAGEGIRAVRIGVADGAFTYDVV